MARLCTIYALSDPRLERVFENVRYVGKTWKPLRTRLSGHLCRKNAAHKSQWIRSLESEGLVPAIWPLSFCSIEDWQQVEKSWIARLRPVSKLTNVLNGGGAEVIWTDEIKRKLSEAAKHRKPKIFSAIHRERIRIAAIGRKRSPESIAKSTAALTGKKRSPEICAKFSMIQKNRGSWGKHSEATKSKIAAAHIGIRVSDEAKRKISIANSVPVICFDTGEQFDSAVKAAKHFGVSSTTIKRATNTGRPFRGIHFGKILRTVCPAQP